MTAPQMTVVGSTADDTLTIPQDVVQVLSPFACATCGQVQQVGIVVLFGREEIPADREPLPEHVHACDRHSETSGCCTCECGATKLRNAPTWTPPKS